jgi:hypothetical protein
MNVIWRSAQYETLQHKTNKMHTFQISGLIIIYINSIAGGLLT